MNKDQKLLEECYQQICESAREPLYFGPGDEKQKWIDWPKTLKHEVHQDGSVSVDGSNVYFGEYVKDRIPFNFKYLKGSFYCFNNKLTSLEGSPEELSGNFNCYRNNIASLKGAPRLVGGTFDCTYNPITSLEGAPEVIKGLFYADRFSDEDYRAFVKKRKYVDSKLDKDLNVDLEDFS